MKIGFLQYAVIQRNREANLEYIASKVKDEKFDLLVLPEFFTSGYAFDKREELLPFVENLEDSPTIKYLTAIAKNRNGYITGTIPEGKDGKIYNTAIIVGAEGLVGIHRKVHLPDYEKRFFSAGNRIETADCGGVSVGMAVCFDCWFAPLTSKLRQLGAQIICHSACFGGEVTPTIIPIRALENQCFFISCNRIGTEFFDGEEDSYRGESQIVNSDGKVLLKAGGDELLAFVDIDLKEVSKPAFGSLITNDFISEHAVYEINIR